MIASRNLKRNLRPFAKVSEEFLLITPNRYAVLAGKRSPKAKRRGIPSAQFCVIGTLNEPVAETGRFAMSGLLDGRMESLPMGNIPDLDAFRSSDAVVRFSLSEESVLMLQKAAKLLKSTHFGIVACDDALTLKVFCRDTSNDHWLDPWHLARGKRVFKSRKDRKPVPALCHDARNSFTQKIDGWFSHPFSGAFEVNALKSMGAEDFEVTIDVKGVVEMIGVESGLVFLIPTSEI